MNFNSGKKTLKRRTAVIDQGNFSGGRFVLSAVVLSLLLLVYFSAPMAFANEDAGSSEYGGEAAVGEDAAVADPVPAAPAEAAGETVAAAVASEPQAAEAQYVSAGYDLSLICGTGPWGTYWESREDYDAGLLSVDYRMENHGTGTAYNVCIVDATANQGVTVATQLPLSLGDIVSGGWKYFTLKWLVPKGVGSFKTDVQACVDCEEDDHEADDGDEEEPGDDPEDDPGDDDDSDDTENPVDGGDTPKDDEGGQTPVDGGVTVDNTAGGPSPATIYRSALPNTGAGMLADVALGTIMGLFGLLGLWITLRVAGARRQ